VRDCVADLQAVEMVVANVQAYGESSCLQGGSAAGVGGLGVREVWAGQEEQRGQEQGMDRTKREADRHRAEVLTNRMACL
jgi:hypothetical protein